MNTNEKTQLPIYHLDYKLLKTYGLSILEKEKANGRKLEMNYINITPDEKYIVCGYKSGEIAIFDKRSTEIIKYFKAHKGKVIHIEFYKPNNLMFTCGADGKILVFDLNTYKLVNTIQQPRLRGLERYTEIRFVLISEKMEHIYFGSQNACLYKCDKSNNYKPYVYVKPDDMYPSESYALTSGVFSHNRKYLVFASGYSLKFVNLKTGKVDKLIGSTDDYINDITFYPHDRNIVATWSEDGTITYWNIQTEEKIISYSASDNHGYSHLVFDPTGRFLASANDKNYVNVWDVKTKHLVTKIKDKINKYGWLCRRTSKNSKIVTFYKK